MDPIDTLILGLIVAAIGWIWILVELVRTRKRLREYQRIMKIAGAERRVTHAPYRCWIDWWVR